MLVLGSVSSTTKYILACNWVLPQVNVNQWSSLRLCPSVRGMLVTRELCLYMCSSGFGQIVLKYCYSSKGDIALIRNII